MARKSTKTNEQQELIKGVTCDPEPVEETTGKTVSDEDMSKTSFYDPEKAQITLDGLATISKDVKKSMRFVDKEQLRIIIDTYYQAQASRIALENQLRSVNQGYDEALNETAIYWMVEDARNRENQIKKMITEYANNHPVCQWAMACKGIGPIFAAKLWASIDMDKCKHANQFLNYVGLNDNNIPWLGKEKAEKIVNAAYEECGLEKSDPMNDDVIIAISMKTGRKFESILRGYETHKEKLKKTKSSDRVILVNYLAKPPYNLDLKTTCFLIGEAFLKVSNRGSKYGMLYRERRAWETIRNENGEYKEQADKLLSEKNYAKNTDTYKCLAAGKLSPGHILNRSKRYATKIFLTHFFEACWIYTYGTEPPVIYPIAFQEHVDYITPEVPYSDFIKCK